VYFPAETKKAGLELWVTDGTASGTRLLKDIRPGPKASKPEDLTAVGDLLYFTATDGKHGRELWRSDGTAEGTSLVADLAFGKGGSLLGEFAALGDELLFAVWDGPGELVIPGTLYRTDGTEAGTQPLGPVGGGDGLRRYWSEFPATARVDDRLVFVADDGISGPELWSTDGTAAGTELVYDLWPGPKGSAPEWLVAADDYVYFTADDGEHGRQLWQLPA
jgi:ELWxxDGT repeat protein